MPPLNFFINMNLAGHLDARIELYSPEIMKTKTGHTSTAWKSRGLFWANVTLSPGRRVVLDGEMSHSQTLNVRMRYNRALTEDWRIVYEGETYAIEGVYKSYRDDLARFGASRITKDI